MPPLPNAIDDLQEEVKKLKKQVEDLESNRQSDADFAAGTLRGAFDASFSRFITLDMQVDERMEKMKKETHESTKSLKRGMIQMKTSAGRNFGTMQDNITGLEGNIAELEGTVEGLKGTVEDLERDLENGSIELATLRREVAEPPTQLRGETKAGKTGIKGKMQEMRKDIRKMKWIQENLDSRLTNAHRYLDHHQIEEVGLLEDSDHNPPFGVTMVVPDHPRTVGEFWALADPFRRKIMSCDMFPDNADRIESSAGVDGAASLLRGQALVRMVQRCLRHRGHASSLQRRSSVSA